jgi:hypothetical protein
MPEHAVTSEGPAADATIATMGAPEAAPMTEAKQRALAKHFTPDQLAALTSAKTATEESKPAALESEGVQKPSAAATSTEDEIVLDLSQDTEDDTTTTDTSDETPSPLTDDELKSLDEKARKKVTEAHKEAAKVRKRAQAAEQQAAELTAKLKALEEADAQRSNSLPAEFAEPNSLSHVYNDKVLDAFELDARNVLTILKHLANGDEIDTTYRSRVDGKDYEIDHTYASWAAGTILDADLRRKQLGTLKQVTERASKLEARLKDTPGFTDHLKAITGGKLATEWPQVRVEAAIGRLVTGGQYRLIKISQTGKADGATSPSAVTAPTPKKAPTSSPSTPQREMRGSMPGTAPANGDGVSTARLSQLEQQAMKSGSADDVKALMKAKMEIRNAQRARS